MTFLKIDMERAEDLAVRLQGFSWYEEKPLQASHRISQADARNLANCLMYLQMRNDYLENVATEARRFLAELPSSKGVFLRKALGEK